ncbi:MAG: hypothetical protein H0U73_02320 [Tatlockia sp.]|nr:hypothetical protein [Tatlockia sp.]
MKLKIIKTIPLVLLTLSISSFAGHLNNLICPKASDIALFCQNIKGTMNYVIPPYGMVTFTSRGVAPTEFLVADASRIYNPRLDSSAIQCIYDNGCSFSTVATNFKPT